MILSPPIKYVQRVHPARVISESSTAQVLSLRISDVRKCEDLRLRWPVITHGSALLISPHSSVALFFFIWLFFNAKLFLINFNHFTPLIEDLKLACTTSQHKSHCMLLSSLCFSSIPLSNYTSVRLTQLIHRSVLMRILQRLIVLQRIIAVI